MSSVTSRPDAQLHTPDASDIEWERFMEATQTVLGLKADHTLTQTDVDDILFVGEYERRDQERQVDCFHRGWQLGLETGAGKTKAKLHEEVTVLDSKLSVERALGRFYRQRINALSEALKPFAYGWTIGVSASHEAAIKTARAVLGPELPSDGSSPQTDPSHDR